jgi:hypothetical protein
MPHDEASLAFRLGAAMFSRESWRFEKLVATAL